MGWKWLEDAKQTFDSLMESGETKPVSKNTSSFIIPNIHPLTQEACKTLLGNSATPSDLKNLTNVAGLLSRYNELRIVHGQRPPMDAETRAGVLTAAFEKQVEKDRERSFPRGPVIKL